MKPCEFNATRQNAETFENRGVPFLASNHSGKEELALPSRSISEGLMQKRQELREKMGKSARGQTEAEEKDAGWKETKERGWEGDADLFQT